MTLPAPDLSGRTILVTAQRRAAELANALERHGAVVVCATPLGVVSQVDDETLLTQTRRMVGDPFGVLVITTGTGFRTWLDVAAAAGLRETMVGSLSGTRLVARGPKAHGALRAAGLQVDWVAGSETAAEIADRLCEEDIRGLRIGIQQHASGDDGLGDRLRSVGARTESLVIYRWGPPPDPAAVAESIREAAAGRYDAVVFTSASGAAAWLGAVDEAGVRDDVIARCTTGQLTLAAVGDVTAAPLRDAGVQPLVPDRGRMGSLVRVVTAHLGR